MASYNKTLYPLPDRRDPIKMKEFMRMKYIQKRFMEEDSDASDNNDSDDSEKPKKAKKKNKKTKKKTKPKKKPKKKSSSDEESDQSSDEEEKDEPEPPKKAKVNTFKKPKSSRKVLKTAEPVKVKEKEKPKPKPKQDVSNILDLDFGDPAPANPITIQSNTQSNDSGWGDFAFGQTEEPKPKTNDNGLSEAWSAFDTKTIQENKTENLLSSLGDLYKSAPQNQFSQQNQFPQQNPFGQFSNQFPTSSQPMQSNLSYPSNANTQSNPNIQAYPSLQQYPQPAAQTSAAEDPFASAMREQQNQKMMAMQKQAQASQYPQNNTTMPNMSGMSGGNNSSMTPNMFFQQMMNMMQNQGNQQNSVMMMAAMQKMMGQMNVGSGTQSMQTAPAQPEPAPTPAPAPVQNTAFKSLFDTAATSSVSSRPAPRPAPSSTAPMSDPSGWGSFGQNTMSAPKLPTEPKMASEPFANFATDTGSTATQNDIFGAQFSNSGFSGFSETQAKPDNSSSGASSNPFDMFKS